MFIYNVTCSANRSEPAPMKTAGEEISSFHLHHSRQGSCMCPASRRTGNALAGSGWWGPAIGWWHVPRRCWQYERRPMKVTVRLPSTFAELAARSPDRSSQSYARRPGERCSRFVPQVPIAPRCPSVSSYRYKVASATAITFHHPCTRSGCT